LLVVESERTSGGEQWRLSVGGEAEHALFANDADSRIIVQRADEAGAFSEARFGSEFLGGLALLPAFGAQRRVIFRGDFVPVLAAEESNAANESSSLTLTGASHSRLGNLMTGNGAELSNADIEMGDVLTLDYVNSPREGGEAAWVLWLAPSVVAQNRTRRVAEGEALPTQFALHPARPNPFAHTTSLHFDLPREERVRLVVHDIQGREVARISDASWPAGRHAIEWNGRATNDARLAAGVYVCRFTAGLFTAQRKLTLLP
jgi:hypothetical protein